MSDPSDDELLQLLRKGEQAAFRVLVKRYDRRLYRVARSVLADNQEAEDSVQEAFFRAFKHLGEFRGKASISTWLYRIVLNEAARRRPRRSPEGHQGLGHRVAAIKAASSQTSIAAEDTDPESAAERKEMRELLERAIDGLPEAFRAVFVLRDVEDVSVKEVASLLDIREETVKTRLHRARRLLRQTLTVQFGSAVKEVFPFTAERCERLIEVLWNRLLPVMRG